ncbi:MAG: DUF4974 domain-containing protein [Prevotella sp.]|nr:DUF4974 domain-containing protein [Prevotella sp.]MBQ9223878.1 DUF4974 domain-containing protein [Prevotella sp.]
MNINEIIFHKITHQITAEEEALLSKWLKASPAHQRMYEEMLDSDHFSDTYKTYSQLDIESAWKKIMESSEKSNTSQLVISRSILRYAAAILVLIVAGAFFWYSQYTKVTPPEISESVKHAMQQSILSEKHQAVIDQPKVIMEESGTENTKDIHQEDIHQSVQPSLTTMSKDQLLAARRITTMHDKEYWVTLDDGTLVHLNYNSRLIYPEKFGRGDRNVILDGEAYFMVAKDRSRPFIVHIPGGSIKVYGTEFNVNTSESPSVVLIKGSISVTPTEGKEQILKPGEQATFNQQSSTFIIEPTNVEPYIAWNTGDFVFHEWPLSRIMNIMSKWYNVDVEFSDEEVANKKLNGIFSRYSNIEETMETIKIVTGFTILINNNHIIIKK